jgi:hypothetical protein
VRLLASWPQSEIPRGRVLLSGTKGSAVLVRAVECLLHHEATDASHTPEQPVVLITSALCWALGPLRLFVKQMLAWPAFYERTGLQQPGARHVALHTSSHYVIVMRHCCAKPAPGQPDEGDDAHQGLQQAPALNYMQITRAHLQATVFCEDSHPRGPWARSGNKQREKTELWESTRGLFTEVSAWMQQNHMWNFPERHLWTWSAWL